jgi:hypothetical protein
MKNLPVFLLLLILISGIGIVSASSTWNGSEHYLGSIYKEETKLIDLPDWTDYCQHAGPSDGYFDAQDTNGWLSTSGEICGVSGITGFSPVYYNWSYEIYALNISETDHLNVMPGCSYDGGGGRINYRTSSNFANGLGGYSFYGWYDYINTTKPESWHTINYIAKDLAAQPIKDVVIQHRNTETNEIVGYGMTNATGVLSMSINASIPSNATLIANKAGYNPYWENFTFDTDGQTKTFYMTVNVTPTI